MCLVCVLCVLTIDIFMSYLLFWLFWKRVKEKGERKPQWAFQYKRVWWGGIGQRRGGLRLSESCWSKQCSRAANKQQTSPESSQSSTTSTRKPKRNSPIVRSGPGGRQTRSEGRDSELVETSPEHYQRMGARPKGFKRLRNDRYYTIIFIYLL